MNKILVTGANGFIGQSLCKKLIKKDKLVCGIVRFLGLKYKFQLNLVCLSLALTSVSSKSKSLPLNFISDVEYAALLYPQNKYILPLLFSLIFQKVKLASSVAFPEKNIDKKKVKMK